MQIQIVDPDKLYHILKVLQEPMEQRLLQSLKRFVMNVVVAGGDEAFE